MHDLYAILESIINIVFEHGCAYYYVMTRFFGIDYGTACLMLKSCLELPNSCLQRKSI